MLPIIALWKLCPPATHIPLYCGLLIWNLGVYLIYLHDKRRAEFGGRRISESTLHLCSLLGAWAGASLGQVIFRHKQSKVSFQVTHWLVIIAYNALALLYLYLSS